MIATLCVRPWQVPDDFEAPLPSNLQQGGQAVAT